MKIYALALGVLLTLGTGLSLSAQGPVPAQGGGNTGATLGNAANVDERSLVIGAGTEAPAQTPEGAQAGPNLTAYVFRMILVLGLVLGAMYLVFRLIRKASRQGLREDSPIELLSSKSLGPGKYLHVVRLGQKAWLLGSSEQGFSLISELDDKELLDGLALKAATEAPLPKSDFSALLSGLLGIRKKREKGSLSAFDPSYLSRQKDRLRKYREPQ